MGVLLLHMVFEKVCKYLMLIQDTS